MVLPKEVRKKAQIKAGDKVAVAIFEKDDQVCCITLIKTERLGGMVKTILSPIAEDIVKK
jgi:bifunctional DNA-binding transcriptional regulator/antitoxin component of YhaV-PrlF toxin-antitoxin module